jgi:hypothetical protein
MKMILSSHHPTSHEKKFIDYWRNIRAAVDKILKTSNTDFKVKAIDSFLEEEIKDNPEFSVFEKRVIDVYIEKVY